MMTIPAQCENCKHYRNDMTCTAFPGFPGIPQDIFDMDFDHRDPYPGDQGIRWEPKSPGVKHPFEDDSKPA